MSTASVDRFAFGPAAGFTLQETFANDSSNLFDWSKGETTTQAGTLIVPSSTFTATRIEFFMKKNGTGGGTITAEIWSSTGSVGAETPNALLASSTTTVDASGVSGTKDWVAFDFAGLSLVSGTDYFFAMKDATVGDVTNNYEWTLGSAFNTTTFETVKGDSTPTFSVQNGGRGGYCRVYV